MTFMSRPLGNRRGRPLMHIVAGVRIDLRVDVVLHWMLRMVILRLFCRPGVIMHVMTLVLIHIYLLSLVFFFSLPGPRVFVLGNEWAYIVLSKDAVIG
jgi:hypothetical protein